AAAESLPPQRGQRGGLYQSGCEGEAAAAAGTAWRAAGAADGQAAEAALPARRAAHRGPPRPAWPDARQCRTRPVEADSRQPRAAEALPAGDHRQGRALGRGCRAGPWRAARLAAGIPEARPLARTDSWRHAGAAGNGRHGRLLRAAAAAERVREIGSVVPGLDPGIHELFSRSAKTWMTGTSPAMTSKGLPRCTPISPPTTPPGGSGSSRR